MPKTRVGVIQHGFCGCLGSLSYAGILEQNIARNSIKTASASAYGFCAYISATAIKTAETIITLGELKKRLRSDTDNAIQRQSFAI